jgi:hypothetical protein
LSGIISKIDIISDKKIKSRFRRIPEIDESLSIVLPVERHPRKPIEIYLKSNKKFGLILD